MKLYSEYKNASISMSEDLELSNLLEKAIVEWQPEVAIETGTFLGTGSTRFLSELFLKHSIEIFYTCEANWNYYIQAIKNLEKYPFTKALWGLTLKKHEARSFIENDPVLTEHELYPDVFIDDIGDPKQFYLNECDGYLNTERVGGIKGWLDRIFKYSKWSGQGLLVKLLEKNINKRLFVILDSAGGVGFLEFQKVLDTLGNRQFLLLLDDTHHLKHFRSLEFIKNSPNFKLLGLSKVNGWALAFFSPTKA